MGISSGRRWRTKENVSILFESELSSSILVPSSNPRTFRKHNQSCIARQCTVTRRFYRENLSRLGNGKRIEVNSESWFHSRRSQSKNRQTVFFTVVNPMDNQDGSGETLCDLSQARIVSYKNTWKRFQNVVFSCSLKLAQQEDCNIIKQDQTQFFSTTHCLQCSLRKRYA